MTSFQTRFNSQLGISNLSSILSAPITREREQNNAPVTDPKEILAKIHKEMSFNESIKNLTDLSNSIVSFD